MKITIKNEPLWISEWINLAASACSKPRAISFKHSERLSPFAQRANELNERIVRQIEPDEVMRKYFERYDQDGATLAACLVFTLTAFEELEQKNAKEIIVKRIQAMDKTKVGGLACDRFGLTIMPEKKNVGFIEAVRELPISDRQKLDLISAFDQPEKSVSEMFALLERIRQAAAFAIEEICAACQEATKEYQAVFTDAAMARFLENWHIDPEQAYLVYPSFADWDSLRLVDHEGKAEPPTIFCGMGISAEYGLKYQTNSDQTQYLNEFLKVAADPSKLEILRLIRDEAMFGQQLAEKMKLKTSTISYHMDALTHVGLINVSKVNNRTYYSMNREGVAQALALLEKRLLG